MGIMIKKFQAPSLQEAIQKVRAELGDNAIILQTEPIRGSKMMGLLGNDKIEVTAAIDRQELPARFHATTSGGTEAAKVASVTTPHSPKQWISGLLGKKATPKNKNAEALKKISAVANASSAPVLATQKPISEAATSASGANASLQQLYALKTFIEPLQKEVDDLRNKMNEGATQEARKPAPLPRKPRIRDPLEDEVKQLKEDLQLFLNEKRFEGENVPETYRQLIHFWSEKGMSRRQILGFLKEFEKQDNEFMKVASHEEAFSHLTQVLQNRIPQEAALPSHGKRIVILVGPTGVGKTTSIAKMAAYEKLQKKRSVALFSIDDYKIGGTDQMAHYARILEVPFTKSRLDLSLEDQLKVESADTIFVDTFGVSPLDEHRIDHLRRILEFSDSQLSTRVEIHLALPVAISSSDAQVALQAFSVLKPQYLIFTKWDETDNWGGMLTTLLTSGKPVSFICHGQSVPDDMSVFSKRAFIEEVTSVFQGEK